MNVMLALLGLILLSPLLLVIALAVKSTSRGPVLYRQERIGLDRRDDTRDGANDPRRSYDLGGKPFMIYKFRTMRNDAESATGAIWASQRDSRVTRVGRPLRRYRLDELLQLVNVLRGEMNIVGPRPEQAPIFAELRENIPGYALRQRAKPGITGWAQINHDYDQSVDDVRTKLRYDLEYLRRQSAWEDVRIMLRTIPAVLFKRKGW